MAKSLQTFKPKMQYFKRFNSKMKLEYKKFANNLTKMKILVEKECYANKLENSIHCKKNL